jgi:hypothetical protein
MYDSFLSAMFSSFLTSLFFACEEKEERRKHSFQKNGISFIDYNVLEHAVISFQSNSSSMISIATEKKRIDEKNVFHDV